MIICHGDDHTGMQALDNMCVGLEFAKIPFSLVDLKVFNTLPQLQKYSSVLLFTERVAGFDKATFDRLKGYVGAGGGLFVGMRCWNRHLCDLFGLSQAGGEPALNESAGLVFDKEIFPGLSGLKLTENNYVFCNSRYQIGSENLDAGCRVVARDLALNPLCWTHNYQNGRVVFWNTDIFYCRALRGIFLHSVFTTMKTAVAALAGFAMLHFDDVPPSLADTVGEPVASEFDGLDWNEFHFGIWAKDMMALKTKHDLKYTWYVVMNYADANTGADADMSAYETTSGQQELALRFQHMGRVDDDVEFGLHGYNHEPMIKDCWPDEEMLVRKLKLARELWHSEVPAPTPVSYVPANNWYHRDHIRQLKQVFPEITSVCSLFSMGEEERGEYREFGAEPWENSLLCLPRETYGYFQKPETRMMMLSQIAAMGVWTHFMHADDVYDTPANSGDPRYCRNPDARNWRAPNKDGLAGLYHAFDDWITQVKELFGWMEFVTTSSAEKRFQAHVENNAAVFTSDNRVEIHCSADSLFYIRTGEGVALTGEKPAQVVDTRLVDGGVLNVVRCAAGCNVFVQVQVSGDG